MLASVVLSWGVPDTLVTPTCVIIKFTIICDSTEHNDHFIRHAVLKLVQQKREAPMTHEGMQDSQVVRHLKNMFALSLIKK